MQTRMRVKRATAAKTTLVINTPVIGRHHIRRQKSPTATMAAITISSDDDALLGLNDVESQGEGDDSSCDGASSLAAAAAATQLGNKRARAPPPTEMKKKGPKRKSLYPPPTPPHIQFACL